MHMHAHILAEPVWIFLFTKQTFPYLYTPTGPGGTSICWKLLLSWGKYPVKTSGCCDNSEKKIYELLCYQFTW